MPDHTEFSWKETRILVADDEPDMREIFAAWLRNLGCSVVEASDGREAEELLLWQQFDAVVTDVRMPRVTGIELAQFLRQSSSYTPVVIFVSGHSDLAPVDAYDLGVEAILSKPCEKKTLVKVLRRCVQRRRMIFEADDTVAQPDSQNAVHADFPHPPEDSGVAIGRGGFSMNGRKDTTKNQSVPFRLTFAEGVLSSLSGWGVVRWCEPIGEQSRFGIEIVELEENSRQFFGRWLDAAKPTSFIPKEPVSRSLASASP
jgi:CheY-like chemotaxis protein